MVIEIFLGDLVQSLGRVGVEISVNDPRRDKREDE
jgi:hypothetical protein